MINANYPLVSKRLARRLKENCDRAEIRGPDFEKVLEWANHTLTGYELIKLIRQDRVQIKGVGQGGGLIFEARAKE